MVPETTWKMTTRLFASGDRKIEMVHVTDEVPDPAQVTAVYIKAALIFGEAKKTEENRDAHVHRIEIIITPEIEPTGEGHND